MRGDRLGVLRGVAAVVATLVSLSMVPDTAVAVGEPPAGGASSVMVAAAQTKKTTPYVDEQGNPQNADATEVTDSSTTWTDVWYVVEHNVTIPSRVTVAGSVRLILADGASLTASQGITVQDANALLIYGQERGTGSLTATGDRWAAGIGGGDRNAGGRVTISGGVVNATGGYAAAGIGGGYGSAGGSVTISGGVVNATGGGWAAGIGGGASGDGGTVTISGGRVTATGDGTAAGIGGGQGTTSQGSFSTGDTGNSVVLASSIGDKSQQSGWRGVVFEGNAGRVYGSPSPDSFEVPSGKTLTVPAGAMLNLKQGATITNPKGSTVSVERGGSIADDGGKFEGEGEYRWQGASADTIAVPDDDLEWNGEDKTQEILEAAKTAVQVTRGGKQFSTSFGEDQTVTAGLQYSVDGNEPWADVAEMKAEGVYRVKVVISDSETVYSKSFKVSKPAPEPEPEPGPSPSPSPWVMGVEVTAKPSKLEYEVGEELDLTGLEVSRVWSDGSRDRLALSQYTVSGFDSSKPGKVVVTVSLVSNPSLKVMFEVSVRAKALEVRRLYLPATGEHLYTASEEERRGLVALGWRDEGVAFTMAEGHGTVVHRLYLPGGKHMLTTSEEEYRQLKYSGWRDEGEAFRVPAGGTRVVHRLYNKLNGDHLLTASEVECAAVRRQPGWRYEGSAFTAR